MARLRIVPRAGDPRPPRGTPGDGQPLPLEAWITYRFGLGDLTVRDRYATNIGQTLNWDSTDFEMPDLPDPEHVASRPCALGGGDVLTQESAAAHVSDLAELEALAERFGFAVGDGRAVDLFTAPDAIRRSIAAA